MKILGVDFVNPSVRSLLWVAGVGVATALVSSALADMDLISKTGALWFVVGAMGGSFTSVVGVNLREHGWRGWVLFFTFMGLILSSTYVYLTS